MHAGALDGTGLQEREAVGLVAQLDRGAVHVADRERVALGEADPLLGGERGEEARELGGGGVRVGQRLPVQTAVRPGLERGLEGSGLLWLRSAVQPVVASITNTTASASSARQTLSCGEVSKEVTERTH